MIIEKTKIKGCYLIKRTPFRDERGQFARMFCTNELGAAGIEFNIVNVNYSSNSKKGILRGLHTQLGEYAEDKYVSCICGEILDVCVDINENSPTFGQYVSALLTENNDTSLIVPRGCAHGYLSLTDDSRIVYFVTNFYNGSAEKGYRYDDPFFGINWADYLKGPYILSEKDKSYEFLQKGLKF
jgi:dTDP-4-dehydrorhamnose 3,5-epimerase